MVPDFSFLSKKINILALDDDPEVLEIYQEYLGKYIPYNLTVSSTLQQAETLIKTNTRFHTCIMDLGMHRDEFYLLRKYHNKIPFIVISGTKCLERGAKVNELGAFDVMAKGSLDFGDIIPRINKSVVKGLFLNKLTVNKNSLFHKAFDLIYENENSTISELASFCCCSESNMRKMWHDNFNISPKKMSMVLNVLHAAFEYFNFLFDNSNKSGDVSLSSLFPSDRLKKIRRYCEKYSPDTIDSLLK